MTSPLTRAMETCVHGYKASMEVASAQRRKGAAMREAAGGGGKSGGDGKPPSGRGARVGCLTGASPAAGTGQALVRAMRTAASRVTPWSGRAAPRTAGDTPRDEDDRREADARGVDLPARGESSRFSEVNGAYDEKTPGPTREALRSVGSIWPSSARTLSARHRRRRSSSMRRRWQLGATG